MKIYRTISISFDTESYETYKKYTFLYLSIIAYLFVASYSGNIVKITVVTCWLDEKDSIPISASQNQTSWKTVLNNQKEDKLYIISITHRFLEYIFITPNKCLAYHYIATNMSEQIKAGVINNNVPYVCSH